MPPVPRTPRSAWIAAGLSALAAGGPDAVRVEVLAAGLGVSKGGFYGQFADRPAFLAQVLDDWERRCIDDVLTRVEAEGGDARAKILRAGLLTFSVELAPVDLAVRDWARRDRDVATRLRRVDDARMHYLRTLFSTFVSDPKDVEARCILAFTFAIGQHFLTVGAEAIEQAAARLLAFD